MSVQQLNVVDIISTDNASGKVVLTISDHLDWADSIGHQTLLQSKFNKYLAFIESGELLTCYPDATDRPVTIKVMFKHKPDRDGLEFLTRASKVISDAGFSLHYEVFNKED